MFIVSGRISTKTTRAPRSTNASAVLTKVYAAWAEPSDMNGEKIGVYFQSNIDSLVGRYGIDAENTIKRLLKERKISFLATDIHHRKHDYNVWNQARDIALKFISEKEFDILVNINPSKLVN